MKKCTRCYIEKEEIEFYKRGKSFCSQCKLCSSKLNKNWRLKNKNKLKIYGLRRNRKPDKYKRKNKSLYNKEWRLKNKDYIRVYCKKQYRKIQNIINKIKNNPCSHCNCFFPSFVMQFDHINPTNKIDCVSNFVSNFNLKGALLEISKCELLCANCHALKTAINFNGEKNSTFRKRKELVDSFKKDKKCVDCGYFFNPKNLHFDHLIPSEKFMEIGNMVKISTIPMEQVFNEILKCELVCTNCHAIRTHCRKYNINTKDYINSWIICQIYPLFHFLGEKNFIKILEFFKEKISQG